MNISPETGDIRSVIVRTTDESEEGFREQYLGFGEFGEMVWQRLPRSEWYRYRAPKWLSGSSVDLMREIGIDTDRKSAASFVEASDASFKPLYYLAVAAQNGVGIEALKWIMSNMAAELNLRKLSFDDLPTLAPDRVVNTFLKALMNGTIERNFAKPIFAELLCEQFEMGDDGSSCIERLVNDPRYKAVDDSDIDAVLEEIIAANPDQFEKAKVNSKLIQWFVGQALKATQGKAKPPTVIAKMEQRLAQ